MHGQLRREKGVHYQVGSCVTLSKTLAIDLPTARGGRGLVAAVDPAMLDEQLT